MDCWSCNRLWICHLLWFFLWQHQVVRASLTGGPVGVITAMETQTRQYRSTVSVAYIAPVNCTLEFDESVVNFGLDSLQKSPNTMIFNLEQIHSAKYRFQVSSVTNANVSIYIAPGTVRNVAGYSNNDTTAFFDCQFYAFPPSATLRLNAFEAHSTSKTSNLVYIIFNSTTTYDGIEYFNKSMVSISLSYPIQDFQQVSENMYRFKFVIELNKTAEAADVECMDPDNDTATPEHSQFRCLSCSQPELCMSRTRYPPEGVKYLEFPLEVVLAPMPMLGLAQTSLPLVYDTLWASVALAAPAFANGPFFVTVTWSEPMSDVAVVLPSFGAAGPRVDISQNLTILGPTSYSLLVVPAETGILLITINGTQNSKDLAGNSNHFRINPGARTGAERTVVFSAGPPKAGSLAFAYEHPPAVFEYRATSTASVPSLTVSWKNFVTATQFDVWMTWGKNASYPVANQAGPLLGEPACGGSGVICSESYTFSGFRARLGVEYTVYVRAFNLWGDNVTVSKIFLHPRLDVIADGSYSRMALPDFLSQQQTPVGFHAVVPGGAFLAMNPLKVLSFSTANRSAGDQDPCAVNSALRRCTLLNFHVEAPGVPFLVFQRPIQLQFSFGQRGWVDPYFRPQLRYWEAYQEEWRDAAPTCPPSQAYERWDDVNKIYSVAFCHLTQFAVFEAFQPLVKPMAVPPAERLESYRDPVFFVALIGACLAIVLVCCAWYWACIRPGRVRQRPRDFSEFGIRPMSQRLPGHSASSLVRPKRARRDSGGNLDLHSSSAKRPEDTRQLLALPELPQLNEGGEPPPPPVPSNQNLKKVVPMTAPPPKVPPPPPPRRASTEHLGPAPELQSDSADSEGMVI